MLFFNNFSLANKDTGIQASKQPSLTSQISVEIMCSPELMNLTKNWASEYEKLNPDVNIAINNYSDEGMKTGKYLGIISNRVVSSLNETGIWRMTIGRDAIVPLINSRNPILIELASRGISQEEFKEIITGPANQEWESLIKSSKSAAIHFYNLENTVINEGLSDFAKADKANIKGIKVNSAAELIAAIQNDIYAIGFCRLSDAMDVSTKQILENIVLLPIDKNGNGRIDSFEKIYKNPETFSRGVWVGKYPHTLCGSIYAISQEKPTDKSELAFLEWILEDGQQFMDQNGYIVLANPERISNIDLLTGVETLPIPDSKTGNASIWLLILIPVIIAGLLVTAVVSYQKKNRSVDISHDVHISAALNEDAVEAPYGLYFDKTHTWAFMEKNGIVKIGIDDFLQHVTGTISKIKMRQIGEKIRKGDKILTLIKDGKQLNIYAPVSGTIKEQNKALETDASILNSSPYSDGWVYMLEPKNWMREIEFLFMGDKTKKWLKEEFTRLKEYFSSSARSNSSVYAHIVLQDGGEITDNVLADLAPEIWEDFQTKFIDTSR